MFLQRLWI